MPINPPWDDPMSLPLPEYIFLLDTREAALDIVNNAPALGLAILAKRPFKEINALTTERLQSVTIALVERFKRKHKGGRPASRQVGFVDVQKTRLMYEVTKSGDSETEAFLIRDDMADAAGISRRSLETVLAHDRKPADDLDDLIQTFLDLGK